MDQIFLLRFFKKSINQSIGIPLVIHVHACSVCTTTIKMYQLLWHRYRYDVAVVFILAIIFYCLIYELCPFFNLDALLDRSSVNNIGYILLRCISFVYIIATYSLYYQIVGLIGCDGVIPIHLTIQRWLINESKLNQISHILLNNASKNDSELKKQVLISLIVAIVAIVYPHPVCFVYLYLFYNAIKKASSIFLMLQWDSLLLETLFLSIFLSFAVVTLQNQFCIIIFNYLVKITLFRLMFGSGIVKWMSSDKSWNNLTALTYHFLTQPLPNPIANKMHFLPVKYLNLMTLLTLVVEIGVPIVSLLPSYSIGLYTSIIYTLLQFSIILFGHFGFFNLLSSILGISLLLIPNSSEIKANNTPITLTDIITINVVIALTIISFLIFAVNISALLYLFTRYNCLNGFKKLDFIVTPLFQLHKYASNFHIGNHYGLFANMTKFRDEVIIEVCYDDEGKVWENIPFLYKPHNENLKPLKIFIFPIFHMPRLDWRLWFLSLGNHHVYSSSDSAINYSKAVALYPEWFYNFLYGILSNNQNIISLVGKLDHKMNEPMKFIRVKLASFNYNPNYNNAIDDKFWLVSNTRIILPKLTLNELRKLCPNLLSRTIDVTKTNKPVVETKEEIIKRTLFNKK